MRIRLIFETQSKEIISKEVTVDQFGYWFTFRKPCGIKWGSGDTKTKLLYESQFTSDRVTAELEIDVSDSMTGTEGMYRMEARSLKELTWLGIQLLCEKEGDHRL